MHSGDVSQKLKKEEPKSGKNNVNDGTQSSCGVIRGSGSRSCNGLSPNARQKVSFLRRERTVIERMIGEAVRKMAGVCAM